MDGGKAGRDNARAMAQEQSKSAAQQMEEMLAESGVCTEKTAAAFCNGMVLAFKFPTPGTLVATLTLTTMVMIALKFPTPETLVATLTLITMVMIAFKFPTPETLVATLTLTLMVFVHAIQKHAVRKHSLAHQPPV
jgi:hypothetical protein